MINVIRLAVALSTVALLVAINLPFDRPYQMDFPIDQPPAELLLAPVGLLSVLLMASSVYGIFRFRRWTRKITPIAAICLCGFVAFPVVDPGLSAISPTTSKILAAASAFLWILAMLLLSRPAARVRFDNPA